MSSDMQRELEEILSDVEFNSDYHLCQTIERIIALFRSEDSEVAEGTLDRLVEDTVEAGGVDRDSDAKDAQRVGTSHSGSSALRPQGKEREESERLSQLLDSLEESHRSYVRADLAFNRKGDVTDQRLRKMYLLEVMRLVSDIKKERANRTNERR